MRQNLLHIVTTFSFNKVRVHEIRIYNSANNVRIEINLSNYFIKSFMQFLTFECFSFNVIENYIKHD